MSRTAIWNRLVYAAAVTAMCVLSASCGSDPATSLHQRRVRTDREAYKLGETHARAIIDLQPDTNAICDRLLDVRTRESDFRLRFGDTTADSYVTGFEDYLGQHDRALAKKIL